MTQLERLRQEWTAREASQPRVQRRIWDRAADNYRDLPIPDFEANSFLKRLAEAITPDCSMRTLDVGCGSGIYSMALAPLVGKAVGVDISPRMIQFARARSEGLHLENTDFQCMSWPEADIDALGFRGAFDIVFAHMTPAVCDYETFDKFNSCSRNLCLVEKPTRRRDLVQDAVLRLVGLEPKGGQSGDILQSFTYLWCKGFRPQFYYEDDVWDSKRTVADTAAWCTDRARLQKDLSPAEEAVIYAYVESLAENGLVREVTTTTRVTMIWRVAA